MAVGDIVQVSAVLGSGSTSVTLGANGQPAPWAPPTAGNSLVAIIASGADAIVGYDGWTLRYSLLGPTRYLLDRLADGTETEITFTFDVTEDHMLGVFEVEGVLTYESAIFNEVASGESVASGEPSLPSSPSAIGLTLCQHWASSNTAFDNGYTLDFDYDDGANSELYYFGGAHKVATTGLGTTGSWTGVEYGQIIVGVYGFGEEPPPVTGNANVWDGAAWVPGVAKIWDGAQWV